MGFGGAASKLSIAHGKAQPFRTEGGIAVGSPHLTNPSLTNSISAHCLAAAGVVFLEQGFSEQRDVTDQAGKKPNNCHAETGRADIAPGVEAWRNCERYDRGPY
jgi:hypothetical protein